MKQTLEPLENFYNTKHAECFDSVRSFKYPYTRLARLCMPVSTRMIKKITDITQVIRLYEMSYVAVRTIYDIADNGDVERGVNHLTLINEFLNTVRDPQNQDEMLLQYIFDTASLAGRDVGAIQQAFRNIFHCVEQDIARRQRCLDGDPVVWKSDDVQQYIRQMEFDGIFRLIFELYGEKTSEFQKFWPLVCAGRLHFYLLRDVVEDVAVGLINIPEDFLPDDINALIIECRRLEEIEDRNMNERLQKIQKLNEQFPGVREWVQSQISEGERLLAEHKEVSLKGLKLRTRFLLRGSRKRTQKFFRQVSKTLILDN